MCLFRGFPSFQQTALFDLSASTIQLDNPLRQRAFATLLPCSALLWMLKSWTTTEHLHSYCPRRKDHHCWYIQTLLQHRFFQQRGDRPSRTTCKPRTAVRFQRRAAMSMYGELKQTKQRPASSSNRLHCMNQCTHVLILSYLVHLMLKFLTRPCLV